MPRVGSTPPSTTLRRTDLPTAPVTTSPKEKEKEDSFVGDTPLKKPITGTQAALVPVTAPKPEAPKPEVVPHSWTDLLSGAAHSFGNAMQGAGELYTKAGNALGGFNPLGLEAKALGAATTMLGKGVSNAPEAAGVAIERARQLEKRGEKLVAQVGTGLSDGATKIRDATVGVKNAVVDYAHEVAHAVDYKENIDKLGPGDSYTLGLDGFAGVEGLRAAGKGSVEVSKGEDGKYTVAIDGELAGGVYAEAGGKIGKLGVAAEASAMLGAGGRLELEFDTPDEAKKAAGILLKRASLLAATSASGPIGMMATPLVAPTKEELLFIKQHTSAIELRGNVAAEALGLLGLKSAGAMASVEAKAEESVRVELGDGHPKLIVSQKLSAGVDGSLGLNISDKHGEPGQFAGFVGGSGEGEVSIEHSYDLPQGAFEKMSTHPLQTLKAVASEMSKTQEESVKLGFEAQGAALGHGGGIAGELEVKANLQDLIRSGAFNHVLKGDMKGALEALPESAEVEGKLERFATKGVEVGPWVSVMGFGGGLDVVAQRRDVDEASVKKYSRPAREAYADLAAWMRTAVPRN